MTRLTLVAVAGLIAAGQAGFAQAQDLAERGHVQFQKWCAPCHAALTENQPRLAGTSALEKKYAGQKPATLEDRTDLPADQVKYFIRNGVNAMPPFRKTEIGDADADAIAAYIARNTRP
jgi:mono/diheme cytochrome c family protein